MTNVFENSQIYLYGLGVSNCALGRFLEVQGIPFYVWDDKEEIRQKIANQFPGWSFLNLETHVFKREDTLVLAPSAKPDNSIRMHAEKAGTYCCCDVDLFLKLNKEKKIIGVTGTNGKSTVVSLMEHVLKKLGYSAVAGGNIGRPVFELKEADIYVLELSSFQLSLMQEKALDAAVILNITQNHLDHHPSMADYVMAKMHIFDLVKSNGVKLVSETTPYTEKIIQNRQDIKGLNSCLSEEQNGQEDSFLPATLKGAYNVKNVLSVWCVLKNRVDLTWQEFVASLQDFKSLPHRQQVVYETEEIVFVNDSKATTVAAALKALERFDSIYWLVGGIFKEEMIEEKMLSPYHEKIRALYCFGQDAGVFYHYGQAHGLRAKKTSDLFEALDQAVQDAQTRREKGTILLSPCCSSYDQFKSYEQRGELFSKKVQQIMQGKKKET